MSPSKKVVDKILDLNTFSGDSEDFGDFRNFLYLKVEKVVHPSGVEPETC